MNNSQKIATIIRQLAAANSRGLLCLEESIPGLCAAGWWGELHIELRPILCYQSFELIIVSEKLDNSRHTHIWGYQLPQDLLDMLKGIWLDQGWEDNGLDTILSHLPEFPKRPGLRPQYASDL